MPNADVATIMSTSPDMKAFWFLILSSGDILPLNGRAFMPSRDKRDASSTVRLVRDTYMIVGHKLSPSNSRSLTYLS